MLVPAPEKFSQLNGLRLLIVDDDSDTRDLFSLTFESDGVDIVTAASVSEALEVLADYEPDVVLCNIMMPHQDGYVFIRQVKERDAALGKQTLAIAVTGLAGERERDRGLSAGFDQYLVKPVAPEDLICAVSALTGRSILSR